MSLTVIERAKTHQGIKKRICEHIIKSWPENGRLPSIKELARDMGTGQSSTHQAVKELVQEGFLLSRPRMGTFINADSFKMKSKLESLSAQPAASLNPEIITLQDKSIQILNRETRSYAEGFALQAINPFIDDLSQRNCRIVKSYVDQQAQSVEPYLDKSCDGIVIVNPSSFLEIKCLPSQVIMIINTSSECDLTMTQRYDMVAVEDRQSSYMAGDFVKQSGWDFAGFLGVAIDKHASEKGYDQTSAKRLQGFTRGLGKPIKPEHQLLCWSYSSVNGAQVVRQWLDLNPRPPVLFAACDEIANGFIHGAITVGLVPGKDYQIIGFDGQNTSPDSEIGVLTSVKVPMAEMGSLAAKMMTERLLDPYLTPRQVYLGCSLITGNTVAKR